MKFSNKCDYALRVMLDLTLSRSSARDSATTRDIARRLKIPFKYLQHIIRALKSAGYIRTRAGENGGVYLAKNPVRITVGQIVRLIDGPVVPMSCVGGGAVGKKNVCRVERECAFKPMWSEVKKNVDAALDAVTLGSLADGVKSVKMYHI